MVQTGGGRYTVRQAQIASSPNLLPASQCFGALTPRDGTARTTPVAAQSSPAVHWIRQFSMPVDRLALLAARDCEARELLQFARAPFAVHIDGQWVMGDFRFDRERPLGMSEIALDASAPSRCRYSVPWVPPRAGLLGGAGPTVE